MVPSNISLILSSTFFYAFALYHQLLDSVLLLVVGDFPSVAAAAAAVAVSVAAAAVAALAAAAVAAAAAAAAVAAADVAASVGIGVRGLCA